MLYHFPFIGDWLILIMPGVKIGDGAIIAARSVVVGDVSPYAIVGGNPARVVRERFDADSVARLQAIAWWDRPAEWISANLKLIRGGDPDALERALN